MESWHLQMSKAFLMCWPVKTSQGVISEGYIFCCTRAFWFETFHYVTAADSLREFSDGGCASKNNQKKAWIEYQTGLKFWMESRERTMYMGQNSKVTIFSVSYESSSSM